MRTEHYREPGQAPEGGKELRTLEIALLFVVMLLVVGFDHLTKRLIELRLPMYASWEPIPALAPVIKITHATNTGAAFGLFPSGSSIFMLVAAVVAVAIVIYNFRLPAGNSLFRVALGLQLGGALGNLTDRVRQGFVTDFIDFGPWPVFNLADTSIVAGVILLGILLLREQRQLSAEEARSGEGEPPAEERSMIWNE
ncbi:MAG: signal peptidase II [Candidatus Promineifilaceae bacterium]